VSFVIGITKNVFVLENSVFLFLHIAGTKDPEHTVLINAEDTMQCGNLHVCLKFMIVCIMA